MTFKEQADYLVRNHPANKELMELVVGCEVKFESGRIKYSGSVLVPKNSRGMVECFADNQIVYVANEDKFVILGKPPQLQHYLRVLVVHAETLALDIGDGYIQAIIGEGINDFAYRVTFNLTTGAPATDEDAEAFINLTRNE